ncbi:hypothetical protein [Streptomyces aureocirculatus]|uniref:hypothetical protein n=1 Tax=Streptomyces aureocirculatus TaxID=67275 RepID=UPI001CECF946|nr:hypothetical protein [Streptomyces aureocirculatus]
MSDLADTAKREGKVASATVALNKAALIASDCGLPDLARALCWRHAQVFLCAQPLGAQEARFALEPLVNLARLRIRDGDGNGGYLLLDTLITAVRAKSEAEIDGRTVSFQHLTDSADAHRRVHQWLWTVLLGDGTRALVKAGQWDRARAHIERHHGVGQRLFDGRQVGVLVRCLSGQPTEALGYLNHSTLSEDWEHAVAACLAVLCMTTDGDALVGPAKTMIGTYLALDTSPELAFFRSRLGLAVLDLSARSEQAGVLGRLTHEATTQEDGYVARDVIAHPSCREEMPQDKLRTLTASVASAGLGRGYIPEPFKRDLLTAVAISSSVAEHHLAQQRRV